MNGIQAASAHSSNSRSARATQARSSSGSTQRNVPLPPKCPKLRRAGRLAHPGGLLRAAQVEAQPPVHGVLPAESRVHAGQAGELHRHRLGQQRRLDQGRPQQLLREAAQVRRRPEGAVGGGALELGVLHAERSEDPLAEVVGHGHAGRAGQHLAQPLEPRVGVGAPAADGADRHRVVEPEARGVGEEVAHGRPGWTGGCVEVEHAFLASDQAAVGDEQLRHRRQPDRAVQVAAPGQRAVRTDHDHRGVIDGPAVDEGERVHVRPRAPAGPAQARTSSATRKARSTDWRALRRGSHTVS